MNISTLRILVGTVIPPVLGSLYFSLGMALIDEGASWLMALPMALFSLLYAYPIMLLPSLFYSWVMEKRIRKRKENSLLFFVSAGALGWLCSLVEARK